MNSVQESEIKIEYYDTNESDPLSETSPETCFLRAKDLPEENILIQNNVSYMKSSLCNPLEIKHCDLDIQEKYTTWYRLKDLNGKLLCKYCEQTYSTVQTLRYHVKRKHPEEAKGLHTFLLINKRNKKHICHICKDRFKSSFELKSHVYLHHSVKCLQSSCLYCDATFNSTNDLKEHIFMIHKIISKVIHACNICGYRTSKKSHFKQHSNVHLNNDKIMCHYCDYKTNYKANLTIHERIHTKNKPYLCDVKDCNYRSAAKSALTSHQLKHFPKLNMLFCDKCSYKTVYKQSLKKHLDSHDRNSIRLRLTSMTVLGTN